MSNVMQYRFRLFGPRKGKTMTVNGHQFVKGEAVLVQSSANMDACMRVLSFYGAFAYGTVDYDEAMKKELEENGGSEVHPEAEQGASDSVRGELRPAGVGPAEVPSVHGGSNADAEDGSAGPDSVGNGHEDARVPKFEEEKVRSEPSEPASVTNAGLAEAIMKLDPQEDSHWVATGAHAGKPKLGAVEQAYGKAGATRKDVEAAVPGWNRDKALEVALEG